MQMARSDVYVLDTHTLLWHLSGDRRRLSRRAMRTLRRAEQDRDITILVPAVVLAEAITAIERRKVRLGIGDLLGRIDSTGFEIVPLDLDVIRAMLEFPSGLELHDRMIAATARHYDGKLISRDPDIARVIDVIW
ncbi:MAG TPA: PIN domain-containing protein [Dehalococcoidia bacterium]|jgi:predicted nucleic acid-binding protein|nr:PIN domain-containing protein [Dehalococcoidia bacterium]